MKPNEIKNIADIITDHPDVFLEYDGMEEMGSPDIQDPDLDCPSTDENDMQILLKKLLSYKKVRTTETVDNYYLAKGIFDTYEQVHGGSLRDSVLRKFGPDAHPDAMLKNEAWILYNCMHKAYGAILMMKDDKKWENTPIAKLSIDKPPGDVSKVIDFLDKART